MTPPRKLLWKPATWLPPTSCNVCVPPPPIPRPPFTFFLAARPRLLVNLLLLSMEAARRRGDLPLFPPSGFSIHHELLPVPSFWTRMKRLCSDRLCLMEFWRWKGVRGWGGTHHSESFALSNKRTTHLAWRSSANPLESCCFFQNKRDRRTDDSAGGGGESAI